MNRSYQIAAALALTVLLAGTYWFLNTGYGETSAQGYKYSMALFSACNQRDKAKLQEVADLIQQDVESGTLESRESKWLLDIIDDGLNDRWQAANRAVRRLMDDQVKLAPA